MDHIGEGVGKPGGHIGPQHPAALAHEGVPAGDHHGDDAAGELQQVGAQVGQEAQHVVEQVFEHIVQAGQVQRLHIQVEVGDDIVVPALDVGQVAPQVEGEGLDALHQLGHHKGKDGGDGQNQHQIGGDHRQGAGRPPGPGAGQPSIIEAEKEVARPVEDEGQCEADEQRLNQPQHPCHPAGDQAQAAEYHHQYHRIGDEEQNAFKQLFIHAISQFHIICLHYSIGGRGQSTESGRFKQSLMKCSASIKISLTKWPGRPIIIVNI